MMEEQKDLLLSVIDHEEFMARVMQDEELARELITLFLQDGRDHLIALEEAIAKEDFATAAHEAHNIKGASGNISAKLIWSSAAAVELACKSKNREGAFQHFIQLQQYIGDLRIYAARYY